MPNVVGRANVKSLCCRNLLLSSSFLLPASIVSSNPHLPSQKKKREKEEDEEETTLLKIDSDTFKVNSLSFPLFWESLFCPYLAFFSLLLLLLLHASLLLTPTRIHIRIHMRAYALRSEYLAIHFRDYLTGISSPDPASPPPPPPPHEFSRFMSPPPPPPPSPKNGEKVVLW